LFTHTHHKLEVSLFFKVSNQIKEQERTLRNLVKV
jgi:hypothetical protein